MPRSFMLRRASLRSFTLRPFQLSCVLFLAGTFAGTLVSAIVVCAQSQIPAADAIPTLTFTLNFPGSQPEHYSFRILSTGAAHYQSNGRLSSESSADSDSAAATIDNFDFDFTLAPEMRQKIFDLAAKAGYFKKDVASHHKGMAFTGEKTLAYKDAQRSGQSTYNFTTIPAVEELTSLLQNIAATLEFGHRLQYDHHYQKLALDEELKHMEEIAHDNELADVRAIQPILEQIVADPSIINMTRARAQHLLEGPGAH
jgi:hypothetical protein